MDSHTTSPVSNAPKQGVVFSDSHFLGNGWRQCPERVSSEQWSRLMKGKDIIVMNGDIFDYDFSGSDIEPWLQKASAMIGGWLKQNPQAEFHYIIGNHDQYKPLIDRLARDHPQRLHIHNEEWRIGNALFMHGDYHPKGYLRKQGKREMFSWADMADKRRQERTQEAPNAMAGHGEHAQRLESLLAVLDEDKKLDGVSHLFCGHFHAPALNHSCRESPPLYYHNTGSPLVGASFNPLAFIVNEQQHITNVRAAQPLEYVQTHSPG